MYNLELKFGWNSEQALRKKLIQNWIFQKSTYYLISPKIENLENFYFKILKIFIFEKNKKIQK
jgi:hypothetical protein